jgi:uncharacterized protein involved in copper resistance
MEKARDPNFTQAQATAMVERNIDDLEAYCGYTRDEARKTVLLNIGYFAMYYGTELADRVYSLFQTQHPIFGLTHPTAEEAYRMEFKHNQRTTLDHESHKTNLPMPGVSEAVQEQDRTRKPSQISARNSRSLESHASVSRGEGEEGSSRGRSSSAEAATRSDNTSDPT